MERGRDYFETFREVSRILTSTLDITEVTRVIARLTAQAAGVKGCAILLLRKKDHRLELLANHGLSERYLQKGPIDADRSMPDFQKGVPVPIRDVTTDPRIQYPKEAQAEGIASILSVPMVLKGSVIGVLRLYSETPRDFPQEVEFATALAELGAIALENARLHSHLREQNENLMADFSNWFDAGLGALKGIYPK